MWTLFKKELRENAVWLLGAFVLLFVFLEWAAWKNGWSLVFSSVFWNRAHHFYPWHYGRALEEEGPIPHSAWLLMCCLWASAIAGFQVFGEKARHTWPLLVQLPIARERILLAKMLAGLTIYGIPLLASALLLVLRLSTPGVYPGPFSVWETQSLVWPLLAGMVVYLAVFAASFRQARWFGTKWIVLLWTAPAVVLSEMLTGHFDVFTRGTPWLSCFFEYRGIYGIVGVGVVLLASLTLPWVIVNEAGRREY